MKFEEQAGAELCQAQSSPKLTALYPLANGVKILANKFFGQKKVGQKKCLVKKNSVKKKKKYETRIWSKIILDKKNFDIKIHNLDHGCQNPNPITTQPNLNKIIVVLLIEFFYQKFV